MPLISLLIKKVMGNNPNTHLVKKDIKYLNKDFGGFRQSLIDFTRTYFPDTYGDFNEASPGMMFMELASAIGDVLSYYTDIQLRESLLTTVQEEINLYNIAHSLGHKPKFITPSSVDVDIFQLIPSNGAGDNTNPDFRYALQIDSNAILSTDSGIQFRTLDTVDFSFSSSLDPTDVSVYSIDNSGEVEFFLLKKTVKAVSGQRVTSEFVFREPKVYDKITLPETNAMEVVSIKDSDNKIWYEVPYLAQDLIPIATPNLPYNDAYLATYRTSAPYLLKFNQTDRRFETRYREDERLEIQFGAGVSSEIDEEIVPNPFNVGFGLDYFERVVDLSLDPKNFLYTKTYGRAPANTTLTVKYTIGGGIEDNVGANSINIVDSINITTPVANLDPVLFDSIKESVAINNSQPARGGVYYNDIESIRRQALANFAAQNRAVTKDDYIVRAYAMPPKFGSIAKACVELDQILDATTQSSQCNPFGIDLYVLGYDDNKNFTPLNDAVKYNLVSYFKQYRMLTDAINIKTPFIINIGVDFEIIVNESYNSNEILLKCINKVKEFFDNDKMGINSPIFKSTLFKEISIIEVVLSV